MVKEESKLKTILDEIRQSKRILHQPEIAEKIVAVASSNVSRVLMEIESIVNVGDEVNDLIKLAEMAERHGDDVALRLIVNRACLLFLNKIKGQKEKFTSFELKYLGSLIDLAKESVKADRKISIVKTYPLKVLEEGEDVEEEEAEE